MAKFIEEVAKYFLDFLETDFKKQNYPKRQCGHLSNGNLLVGVDVDGFANLRKKLYAATHSNYHGKFEFSKGEYTKTLPREQTLFIKNKIDQIDEIMLSKLHEDMSIYLDLAKETYSLEFEKYFDSSLEQFEEFIVQHLLSPFFFNLDFLRKFDMEQMIKNISEAIILEIEEPIRELIIQKFDEKFKLNEEIAEIMTVDLIRNNLKKYFDNFYSRDFFESISELSDNKAILDKHEFYLYFYDISITHKSIGKTLKFPIFYLPINIQQTSNSFEITFDTRLFLNIKAINYTLQEYSELCGRTVSLKGEFNRIIDIETNIENASKPIIQKIAQTLGLRFNESLFSNLPEKTETSEISISNKYYFYIFDKSDEALLNDYEAIIETPSLLSEYENLLNSFILQNPAPINQKIDIDWDQLELNKQLVFDSPVPLNKEQKKILLALRDINSKYYIVEGPPGTGKSHTITAIICEAILSNKSVLVLSDKNEALDVVQAKITSTLNKVRSGDKFQNPVLRLGKFQNTLSLIVQQQSIKNIRDHLYGYNRERERVQENKSVLRQRIETEISKEINSLTSIDMKDVFFYFQHEDEFDNYPNLSLTDSRIEGELLALHPTIRKLQESGIQFNKETILNVDIEGLRLFIAHLETIVNYQKNIDNFVYETFEVILRMPASSRRVLHSKLITLSGLFEKIEVMLEKFPIDLFEKITDDLTLADIAKIFLQYKGLQGKISQIEQSFFMDRLPTGFLPQFLISDEIEFDEAFNRISEFYIKLKKVHLPIIGTLFTSKQVQSINDELKKSFHNYQIVNPSKFLDQFEMLIQILTMLREKFPEHSPLIKQAFSYLNNTSFHAAEWGDYSVRIINLTKEIEEHFPFPFKLSEIQTLIYYLQIVDVIGEISELPSVTKLLLESGFDVDIYSNFKGLETLTAQIVNFTNKLEQHSSYKPDILKVLAFQRDFEITSRAVKLQTDARVVDFSWFFENCDIQTIIDYLRFLRIQNDLIEKFSDELGNSFQDYSRTLEEYFTLDMASIMDQSFIDYYDNFQNDLGTLKIHLKKKQKFPKSLFGNMKKAFPCILAGIRDYAEYIPLEKDLFDLIIIDEASQVNIAQTLPALIRGKKILVLGDEQQFSNVKSHNAKRETNNQYKGRIEQIFMADLAELNKSPDDGLILKIRENIDIKVSILRFMRFIRNYEIMLTQHFRCYPEIISYSDQYFYNNKLISIRLRAQDIKDVIKFSVIKSDGKLEIIQNINEMEINFIIEKLREFKRDNITQSLGIITPFREQLKVMYDKIKKLDIFEWLISVCDLKIMTFDTCQGEERDYIFYSMVATPERDRLNYIFPVDFNNGDSEEEGTLKRQRMNVGFSRARDTIHFVLSKEPNQFSGEIGRALIHYQNKLNSEGPVRGLTDPNSPMEPVILKHIQNTQFYKDHYEKIQVLPQFQLGKKLNQEHSTANLRDYVVDYLIHIGDENIVIEYDGFKEHFIQSGDRIDSSNYEFFMKNEDIYRQKVLESYGYKFIRLNKFNLGSDPVRYINDKLYSTIKKNITLNKNRPVILETVMKHQNGELRHCHVCNISYPDGYFPFKGQDLCFDCYEFLNRRVLQKKRSDLPKNIIKEVQIIDEGKRVLVSEDINNAIKRSGNLLISYEKNRFWISPIKMIDQNSFSTKVCIHKYETKFNISKCKIISDNFNK